MERKRFLKSAVVLPVLLVAGLLTAIPGALADPARKALGYAYGAGIGEEPTRTGLPEAQSAASDSTSQKATHQSDVAFEASPAAATLRVATDACAEEGTWALLQAEMDRAAYLANGGDPAQESPEPAREDVSVDQQGYDANHCATGLGATSPEQSDENPNGLVNCEDYDPAAEGAGNRCRATELWNAHAYTKATDALDGAVQEAESEAVARCVGGPGGTVEFMTGARFSPLADLIAGESDQPNQSLNPLALGLAVSDTVTFWETNWDPRTNSTVDGSDTVWVNALHIETANGQDTIVGHAEATAECPLLPEQAPPVAAPTPPPGGFPRHLTLTPSKRVIRYQNILVLSGTLDPATEFNTPESCVENTPVTIRRDPFGGPEEFEQVATVRTDDDGRYTYNFKHIDRNALYVAAVDKNQPVDCAQETSSAKSVRVRPHVFLKPHSKYVKRGRTVRFRSGVRPCEPDMVGTRIKLRRVFKGRPVIQKVESVNSKCNNVFRKKARWRLAVFDAVWSKQTEDHQPGRSRSKEVHTKRRR
ncbi:MAG: hypothetical protein ACRDKZ_06525 [Actinomycetota bacterium]